MAALNEGFRAVSSMFKIPDLNVHQKQAIRKIIVDKEDLFVKLSTGFGKSLIYQSLPRVFDHVSEQTGHIVVVVSPLVSLMEDQVQHLRSLGVSAVNISTKTEIDRSKIEKGEYSRMFCSFVYSRCQKKGVEHWGPIAPLATNQFQIKLFQVFFSFLSKQRWVCF